MVDLYLVYSHPEGESVFSTMIPCYRPSNPTLLMMTTAALSLSCVPPPGKLHLAVVVV